MINKIRSRLLPITFIEVHKDAQNFCLDNICYTNHNQNTKRLEKEDEISQLKEIKLVIKACKIIRTTVVLCTYGAINCLAIVSHNVLNNLVLA